MTRRGWQRSGWGGERKKRRVENEQCRDEVEKRGTKKERKKQKYNTKKSNNMVLSNSKATDEATRRNYAPPKKTNK